MNEKRRGCCSVVQQEKEVNRAAEVRYMQRIHERPHQILLLLTEELRSKIFEGSVLGCTGYGAGPQARA